MFGRRSGPRLPTTAPPTEQPASPPPRMSRLTAQLSADQLVDTVSRALGSEGTWSLVRHTDRSALFSGPPLTGAAAWLGAAFFAGASTAAGDDVSTTLRESIRLRWSPAPEGLTVVVRANGNRARRAAQRLAAALTAEPR